MILKKVVIKLDFYIFNKIPTEQPVDYVYKMLRGALAMVYIFILRINNKSLKAKFVGVEKISFRPY